MGRRRFEMFHYRQVLVRLRAGDSIRELARSGLMGRDKLAMLRSLAQERGWLDPQSQIPDDQAIASAVISMAESMKLQATAEGVETLAQMQFLMKEKCHEAQGYHISYPMTADDTFIFLRRTKDRQL